MHAVWLLGPIPQISMRLSPRPFERSPMSWSANNAFLAVSFTGQTRFSTKLLSILKRPSCGKTSSPARCLAI